MFNNLLESKPKKPKSRGLVACSMVFHVALIGGAVVATAHARQALEKPKEEKVDFVEVKKNEPERPKNEPAADRSSHRRRRRASRCLTRADRDPRRTARHRPLEEGDGRSGLHR